MTHICLCSHSGTQPPHLSVRLTVRTMATPSGLWSACLCGQHAAQAWLVAGGGGLHCELVILVSYAESLAEVNLAQSTF